MSLARIDVHQNQIQIALERRTPAYLGVLGTKGYHILAGHLNLRTAHDVQWIGFKEMVHFFLS